MTDCLQASRISRSLFPYLLYKITHASRRYLDTTNNWLIDNSNYSMAPVIVTNSIKPEETAGVVCSLGAVASIGPNMNNFT
jgi:hypothetical protein